MPWEDIQLNDGTKIPGIAFGTSSAGHGQQAIDQVEQAISVGFSHIDTAQMYNTEKEIGTALRETGLSRKEVYLTTKYSQTNGLDVQTSMKDSLKFLGVSYVDLYLIHAPEWVDPDIPTTWNQLENFKKEGLTKSIGVSNFTVPDLETLLASARVVPAVNQIRVHAYNYAEQASTIALCKARGIVVEAFSSLIPITKYSGGPVKTLVNKIAEAKSATPEQILLAWVKSKGCLPVTTSSKKERLQGYLEAADIELTDDEIAAIDAAGAEGPPSVTSKKFMIKKLRNAALITSWDSDPPGILPWKVRT